MLMSISKDFPFCKLSGLKRVMDRKLEDQVSSSDLTLHVTMQGINLRLSLVLHGCIIPITPPAVPVSHTTVVTSVILCRNTLRTNDLHSNKKVVFL